MLIPERAMLKTVSRSISAAALESSMREGRVKGFLRGSESAYTLERDFKACSCAEIEAPDIFSGENFLEFPS